MSVTREWLESLPKQKESEALDAIRAKSAEFYRAEHGRDPKTPQERTEGMKLLEAEAEAVKAGVSNGNGAAGDYLPGFRPMTRGERRELDEHVLRLWDRGW